MLGAMFRFAWVVAFVGLASFIGCFHPSYRDCAIACDRSSACPSGLSCDMTAGMCTTGASCSGIVDATPADSDGSGSGSGSGSGVCTAWSFVPTNFDPCSIPAATAPLSLTSTDTLTLDSSDAAACPSFTYQSERACVKHFTHVQIDGKLKITGPLPVIIVSDSDIVVGGSVVGLASISDSTACQAGAGSNGGTGAEGAGGGGHLTAGGLGGRGINGGTGGAAGQPFGAAALVPLELGCAGAKGGDGVGPSAGGAGGAGGQALELAAQTSIQITGTITVNGAGGHGGKAVQAAGGGGGGGGGAAGSLFLESPAITITAAHVCALGGGGGQGGNGGNGTIGVDGATTLDCTNAQGGGFGSVGAGGRGGGSAIPGDGVAYGNFNGAGGGGGAAGRIRIHALSTQTIDPNAQIVPAASTQ